MAFPDPLSHQPFLLLRWAGCSLTALVRLIHPIHPLQQCPPARTTGLWKTRAATGSKLIVNEIEENKMKDHCVQTNYVMPRSALMKGLGNYIQCLVITYNEKWSEIYMQLKVCVYTHTHAHTHTHTYIWASLAAQRVKKPPAMQETRLDLWVEKVPWRREWLPTPAFLPGESHGQRSLAGRKELDMTKWLTHTQTDSHTHIYI